MMLNELQIDRVATWVETQKLRHAGLREELLDHICCAIEADMETGSSFGAAYEAAIGRFGSKGLKQVERQTIFLLTYQSRLMKLITAAPGMLAISFLLVSYSGVSQAIPAISPLAGDIEITSAFGMRMHPQLKERRMHTGVDFRADMGTEVLATADGKILIAGVDPEREAFGIMVLIEHQDGYQTMYAHLSAVTVEAGQTVSGGELIGKVGSSGYSLGPHLHYEVIQNGERLNPSAYIPQ